MTQSPFKRTLDTPATFPGDLHGCMQQLRGALTELLASVGDDPRKPQELSRRLGLNKNLAWKACKIINSEDVLSSVQHVPGAGGIKILLKAFQDSDAPAASIDAVRAAMEEFADMVRVHVGDRANLQLYVTSWQPEGVHADELGDKRRLAYQGNSAIWGVQARLGFALRLLAPNVEDPQRADMAMIGGLSGFSRLRPTASWPVLQVQVIGADVSSGGQPGVPIDPDYTGEGPPLIRSHCSDPIPSTRTIVEAESTTYEICEGPVGNTAALDLTFGHVLRGNVPIHDEAPGAVGEHYCRVDTPLEAVQFDLLVHRDLPFELPPKLVTYSRLHDKVSFPLSEASRFHLPGITRVQELGSHPPVVASPLLPDYATLVAAGCRAIGHELDAFRGYRVTLSYPPMPVTLVMYHPLGSSKA